MKSVWISWIMLFLISVFVAVHAFIIVDMSGDITEYTAAAKNAVYAEEWEKADSALEELGARWEQGGAWAAATISAKQIDEIEASLERSKAYLSTRSKTSFLGEFANFELLIKDLPNNEGIGFFN